MKVVMINGQNHKGSSYHIGRDFIDQLKNALVQEFFLPKDLGHFCLGCYRCIKDETQCPYYEEKKRIMDAICAADLLVFTTPTYCMRASAPMKAFIDLTFTCWMPHRPRKCMFSKKAVVLSAAAGTGMKSAVKDVTNTLFYWGVPYIKSYGYAVQAMDWEHVSDKKKTKIQADMERLAETVQTVKVHVGLKTRIMFNIMRMMQKHGMGAGEEERKYWESMGWLGNGRPWK